MVFNPKLIFNLSLSDLQHEWKLSLCLVMAVAAVLAPLLLLMGLKNGVISTMRDRLVEDPVYRELRPVVTKDYPQELFDKLSKDARVAFSVPTVLPLASVLRVKVENQLETVDMIPTANNDVLLLENGGRIPIEGECVLSAQAARVLGNRVAGDKIEVQIARTSNGKRETVTENLTVLSVLNERASSIAQLYAPLQFVLDVERFKDGLSVSERNWEGNARTPEPVYDGVFVLVPKALSVVELSGLTVNTGFTKGEEISAEKLEDWYPAINIEGFNTYSLTTKSSTVSSSSINLIKKNQLRGKSSIVLPFVRDRSFNFSKKELNDFHIIGYSASDSISDRLDLTPVSWRAQGKKVDDDGIYQAMTPPLNELSEIESIEFISASNKLTIPINITTDPNLTSILVPIELLGVINASLRRPVVFNQGKNVLEYDQLGYRGFRLYARSIDDVLSLQRYLDAQDIDVITKSDEIERIRILDNGLTKMFWLIAIISVIGGIAVMVASMYAAVERKTSDLSIMRLIGISKTSLFCFPIFQAFLLSVMGSILAIISFFTIAAMINIAFASDLIDNQKICWLPADSLLIAPFAVAIVAVMSTLFAAFKTMQIDPSEGMRHE